MSTSFTTPTVFPHRNREGEREIEFLRRTRVFRVIDLGELTMPVGADDRDRVLEIGVAANYATSR
jgi:hypothetical protein